MTKQPLTCGFVFEGECYAIKCYSKDDLDCKAKDEAGNPIFAADKNKPRPEHFPEVKERKPVKIREVDLSAILQDETANTQAA